MLGRRRGFARISQRGGVGWGWVGVGWGNTNPTSCYAGDSSSAWTGWGGDGLGWGGAIPTQRLATLVTQHEIDATALDLHWHFNMKLKLRYLIFTGTSTWNWCYAAWSSLVLQHEIDATLLGLDWHFNMKLMLRYLIFTGTSTWNWCYAAWSSLALQHEIDATLHDLHWHFNMKLMLRYLILTGTSTWNWCFATWSSLALQHEIDATLLDLHWHFNMKLMLRYLIFTGTSTWSVCWMPTHPTCPKCWIKWIQKNVWELGLAQATGALRPKMKKSDDANPCKGCTEKPFFQKNGVPKIIKNDASLRNETMWKSRSLTNANVQNTHLATATIQFSRKRSHVKNTNELSTTLDSVMNATSTRANLPRQPNVLLWTQNATTCSSHMHVAT